MTLQDLEGILALLEPEGVEPLRKVTSVRPENNIVVIWVLSTFKEVEEQVASSDIDISGVRSFSATLNHYKPDKRESPGDIRGNTPTQSIRHRTRTA